jgi:hypothetical protein
MPSTVSLCRHCDSEQIASLADPTIVSSVAGASCPLGPRPFCEYPSAIPFDALKH